MKLNEFSTLVHRLHSKTKETLLNKNKEYAEENDVFHNFDVAADILRHVDTGSRPGSAMAFAVKHLVSIIDIVNSPARFSSEQVDEKIGDMINYLILIRGMIYDEQNAS